MCVTGDERARGCAGSSGKSICRRRCNDLKFSLTKAKRYFRSDRIISEKSAIKVKLATYDILSGKTDMHPGVQNFNKTRKIEYTNVPSENAKTFRDGTSIFFLYIYYIDSCIIFDLRSNFWNMSTLILYFHKIKLKIK